MLVRKGHAGPRANLVAVARGCNPRAGLRDGADLQDWMWTVTLSLRDSDVLSGFHVRWSIGARLDAPRRNTSKRREMHRAQPRLRASHLLRQRNGGAQHAKGAVGHCLPQS